MEHLILCKWPGNVRQLQNEMRRVVALAEPNSIIMPEALSEVVFNTQARSAPRRPPRRRDGRVVERHASGLPWRKSSAK